MMQKRRRPALRVFVVFHSFSLLGLCGLAAFSFFSGLFELWRALQFLYFVHGMRLYTLFFFSILALLFNVFRWLCYLLPFFFKRSSYSVCTYVYTLGQSLHNLYFLRFFKPCCLLLCSIFIFPWLQRLHVFSRGRCHYWFLRVCCAIVSCFFFFFISSFFFFFLSFCLTASFFFSYSPSRTRSSKYKQKNKLFFFFLSRKDKIEKIKKKKKLTLGGSTGRLFRRVHRPKNKKNCSFSLFLNSGKTEALFCVLYFLFVSSFFLADVDIG